MISLRFPTGASASCPGTGSKHDNNTVLMLHIVGQILACGRGRGSFGSFRSQWNDHVVWLPLRCGGRHSNYDNTLKLDPDVFRSRVVLVLVLLNICRNVSPVFDSDSTSSASAGNTADVVKTLIVYRRDFLWLIKCLRLPSSPPSFSAQP